ncbi:MAG: hypothetical protein PHF37_01100 [Phycisphaerae bacterium]|nr:hypothetical protein [Phycisphaerae bacterium]
MVNSIRVRVISILFLSGFLVGCMSDEANRFYLKQQLPAKEASEVEVLQAEPSQPYIVIADFQANNATIRHMQKRAAEIGADAVIVVPVGGWYSPDEVWAGQDRYSNTYTRLIATAIKYKN